MLYLWKRDLICRSGVLLVLIFSFRICCFPWQSCCLGDYQLGTTSWGLLVLWKLPELQGCWHSRHPHPTLYPVGQLFTCCPQAAAPVSAAAPISSPRSTAQLWVCPGFVTQASLLRNSVPINGTEKQTAHGGVQLKYQLESRDHKSCSLSWTLLHLQYDRVYLLHCYILSFTCQISSFSHMLNHFNHCLHCRFRSCISHTNLKYPETGCLPIFTSVFTYFFPCL